MVENVNKASFNKFQGILRAQLFTESMMGKLQKNR